MNDDFSAKLEKLRFYRSEIKQEYDLLSNRVSSYVTSQSFLCIALTASMSNQNPKWGELFTLIFPIVFSLIGIATSIQSIRAISAASKTIGLWHLKQNELFENTPELADFRIERVLTETNSGKPKDVVFEHGLTFARWSPPIFIAAWCVFFWLAIFFYFKK